MTEQIPTAAELRAAWRAERARQHEATKQLSRDDLKTMQPDAIIAAKDAGRLNELMGIPVRHTPADPGNLTRADLKHMSPAEILDARKAGKLDGITRKDS
jgi:ABC-type hemin transport system substrate-binding protein